MKKWMLPALCLLLTGCAASSVQTVETAVTSETTADRTAQTEAVQTTTQTEAIETTTQTEAVQTTTQTEPVQTTTQTEPDSIQDMLERALPDVRTELLPEQIVQKGRVQGTDFTLTVDLQKWAQLTTEPQIVRLCELFWECYPRMYARFHDLSDPPAAVTLAIENEGYEIAATDGLTIHLHDRWLYDNPGDYDCITHELAHVIQAGWDGEFLEYSSYIERFADCCRYEYAMQNGICNDAVWTLQTVLDEPTREDSVRFLVWLDACFSDADTDILRRYFRVCHDMQYPADRWDAAWQEIFSQTALEGKTVGEVWALYQASDFAYLSAEAEEGGVSDLLAQYPVRQRVRGSE